MQTHDFIGDRGVTFDTRRLKKIRRPSSATFTNCMSLIECIGVHFLFINVAKNRLWIQIHIYLTLPRQSCHHRNCYKLLLGHVQHVML
jgi:hypothetical protein